MEHHPYPISFSEDDERRLEELKMKLSVYLLARAHYQRILSETDLLLMFAETFAHNNMVEAVEQVLSTIRFIEERIREVNEQISFLETAIDVKKRIGKKNEKKDMSNS